MLQNKTKDEKIKILLMEEKNKKNFDIKNFNLQQKAIFRSIINLIDNNELFMENIKLYLKNDLSKNDLLDLYKNKTTQKNKIDISNFTNIVQQEIKKNLQLQALKKEQIKVLKPYFNNQYNIFLLKNSKAKNNNNLGIHKSKKEKDFIKNKLKENNINLDFYQDNYKKEVEEIFKIDCTDEIKNYLIGFSETYISDKEKLQDEEQLFIKSFVLNNRLEKLVLYLYFLKILGYDFEEIEMFIINIESNFESEQLKNFSITRLKSINKYLSFLEKNFNKKQKNISKNKLDEIFYSL